MRVRVEGIISLSVDVWQANWVIFSNKDKYYSQPHRLSEQKDKKWEKLLRETVVFSFSVENLGLVSDRQHL